MKKFIKNQMNHWLIIKLKSAKLQWHQEFNQTKKDKFKYHKVSKILFNFQQKRVK